MPEVSVLITNYNYATFLGRCLRSVLTQTFARSNYEVVLVDDGSTDHSDAIYRIFENDLIIIENQENLGLSTSLNVGLRNCHGRYIVRVDADDYIHSEFISFLHTGHELLKDKFDAVSCDYFEVSEDGSNYRLMSSYVHPIACGIMFKSEVFEQLGFYNENIRVGEDLDLMARFKKANLSLYNINLPLYRYVNHGESLSRQFH
jgi:glycosyltransferase involved in cell wall biosynthesis